MPDTAVDDPPIVRVFCLATKWEHPDDPMPMVCTLGPDHPPPHRTAGRQVAGRAVETATWEDPDV